MWILTANASRYPCAKRAKACRTGKAGACKYAAARQKPVFNKKPAPQPESDLQVKLAALKDNSGKTLIFNIEY